MTLIFIKIVAASLILLVSLLAGWIQLRIHENHSQHQHLGEAFASGIFLGAALFHMLPDAEHSLRAVAFDTHYPYVNLLCALGFASLLLLEKVMSHFIQHGQDKIRYIIPYVLTIVLSIHAITEGLALGINTTLINTAIIFLAIIVHKSSESFALASNLSKCALSYQKKRKIILGFAFMTPFGIMLSTSLTRALTAHSAQLAEAIFNAFAAGTFLYIATLHNVSHTYYHEDKNLINDVIANLCGLSLMALVALWI